jgi:hypothetical protein
VVGEVSNTNYPEHQKMKAVKPAADAIANFLEWIREEGMTICRYEETRRRGEYFPVRDGIKQLLAAHLEIDLKKIDDEKDAMLKELRAANKSRG